MEHLQAIVNNPVSLTLLVYATLSLCTFALYFADKSAARANSARISERTLHIFALLGGWPGALAGQQLFRHKTRKQPFRAIFWCTVIANIAALIWLFFGDDATLLESLPARIEHLFR